MPTTASNSINLSPMQNKQYKVYMHINKVNGKRYVGITKACQGINQTYKGYIWEYADKKYKKPKHNGVGNYPHTKIQKPVKLIDVDGREYIFESQKKAAEFVGIKRNMVSQYLNGYCTDKTGRGWSYA